MVLKPVNEIRFIRQIKVWIKNYNIIRWYFIRYVDFPVSQLQTQQVMTSH